MGLMDGKDGEADTAETVLSLTRKVIAGELDATTAGQKIRKLVSNLEPATTDEERRERYHEAAIETDPNSFNHVEGLKLAGALSQKDYRAIRNAMYDDEAISDTDLKLERHPQPEEAWEWHAELDGVVTGWRDVESPEHLLQIARSITHENDWFTVETKYVDNRPYGRFAQAANVGNGYLVEVAKVEGGTTLSWRIGLGVAADDAGNEPNVGPVALQILSLAAMIEVVLAWFRGKELPQGYGAALHVYHGG
ncbi:hypothetical protein J3A64_004768 [Pseudarthrobacter sp. PvP004]|uniref:hypothetical protein n=1 Tax=Pseudarthrobacter sp. PvP004 TaxID=2817850 RepID=UPI001AEA4353|nr:hypothetical protein [Pseudarthrobacter sp. PvP004]MBP2269228.1 hypothetical protein [Pseudarthrobacter sp. PvP004]